MSRSLSLQLAAAGFQLLLSYALPHKHVRRGEICITIAVDACLPFFHFYHLLWHLVRDVSVERRKAQAEEGQGSTISGYAAARSASQAGFSQAA